MSTTEASLTYKIHSAVGLHWVSWADEYVIFDEASGHTHQIDSLRAFVLNLLTESCLSVQGILGTLNDLPDLANDPNTAIMVGNMLNEFVTLGLVEVAGQ